MAHVERAPRRSAGARSHPPAHLSAARTGDWIGRRHSLRIEAATVLGLYGLYEASRGLVVGRRDVAIAHAHEIASLERHLHVFIEGDVQRAAQSVPGLVGLLGLAYLTLHLTVTAGYLLWLHQRRPDAFPFVRNTLLLASALSLIGFLLYPTAPPRGAGLGIQDTISGNHVNLDRGLVASLYNPYAAIPSMHVGYALVIGLSLLREGRRRALRVLGAIYPALVVLIIVATGNHFLLDAVAGAVTVGIAAGICATVAHRRARSAPRAPVAEAPWPTRAY